MPKTTAHNFDVYQPRNPKASAYSKCVENHFEELEKTGAGHANKMELKEIHLKIIVKARLCF